MSNDAIAISFIGSFSGPYGAIITPMFEEGFLTWVEDVNARGGIHNRKVVVKRVDHAETVEGGIAACKQAVSNGTFMAVIGEGTGEGNDSAANCLDKAGFLNFGWLSNPNPAWRSSFSIVASSSDFGTSLPSVIENMAGDKGKKVGLIASTPLAFAVMKDAYLKEAKARGLNIVGVEKIEPTQTSFAPQLLRLRDAGAQHVTILSGIESVGVLRDAAALNYRPKWTGGGWIYDIETQAARDTAKGVLGLKMTTTVDTPAFAAFMAKKRQRGIDRPQSADGEALLFYGEGLVMEEVLRRAGPMPTTTTLRAGMESMKGFETAIFPPITWGPGNVLGTHASWPVVCCNADWTWKSMGPPQERFTAATPQASGSGAGAPASAASRPAVVRRPHRMLPVR
ncbi:MAG: ABC transporter substrate-binding protein [Actinomycetota bacterium]